MLGDERPGHDQVERPGLASTAAGTRLHRAVRVDDDLLPTTTIAVRLPRSQENVGWIVGEISLEELWRMVDTSRSASTATR